MNSNINEVCSNPLKLGAMDSSASQTFLKKLIVHGMKCCTNIKENTSESAAQGRSVLILTRAISAMFGVKTSFGVV